METFEHTKLKPLSISLSIDAINGKMLSAVSAQAGYKGLLAEVALKKYGPREDTSGSARERALKQTLACTGSCPISITIDKKSSYPALIQSIFPMVQIHLVHRQQKENAKSRAQTSIQSGRMTGGSETNETTEETRPRKADPLFLLNVSAAKIRHDLSRMARKVWVTTKKCEFLQRHLDLYIAYHNKYALFY